jgi:hypothetical protein
MRKENKNLTYAQFRFAFDSNMARHGFVSFHTQESLGFSNTPCHMCGSSSAGERYEGMGLRASLGSDGMTGEGGFEVCEDCRYYAEYGILDDVSMLDIDMQESDSFLELLMQGVKVTEVNPYILDFALENAGEKFTLRIEDICANNADNQAQVCYNLYDKHGKVIFNGADIFLGCGHEVLKVATFKTVMGFLTLRLGDTDKDYFDEYTPAQIEFRDTHAEYLSLLALDYSQQEQAQHIKKYFEGLRGKNYV